MHLLSGLTPLVAFLALLAKATAQDSAPFELASHVIEPTNNALNGLSLTAFSYHPGGFFYATLAQPTEGNPALVSVLTGPTGNQTLETSSIEGFTPAYIAIGAGSTNAPAAYDSVQFVPDQETTFGFQFVSDDVGDILTWNGVAGDWYCKFSITLSIVVARFWNTDLASYFSLPSKPN